MSNSSKPPASAPSRREFLKAGALVAAPLAAVAAPAVALADDGSRAKLARLEAERTIEQLHREWLRRGAPGTAAMRPEVPGDAARIEVSADGTRASACQHCIVAVDGDSDEDCTLLQMARLQGNPPGQREEVRELTAHYAHSSGSGWQLAGVDLV